MLTLFTACEEDKLDVDVSAIDVQVKMERMDQVWADINPVTFRKSHAQYQQAFPELYKHYIEDVLQMGSIEDTNLYMYIREFTTHPDFEEVFAEVEKVYPDLSEIEMELTDAWKHYRYYFPDRIVPNHVTCVGGFNAPYILTERSAGICLELYLGADCRFYDYLQWPVYQRTRMTPEHLVPWLMKSWLETEFPLVKDQSTLLEDIVHQGKIYYLMDAMLRGVPDSIKIGYTTQEMAWAVEHERFVWAHFVDNELLFNAEPALKGKFTNDGPFTVDLVKESPSRMGHFIGWQMVRAYMETQDFIDLEALMRTQPEQILRESKYKP